MNLVKNKLNLLITLLVITAVVLGAIVYSQSGGLKLGKLNNKSTPSTTSSSQQSATSPSLTDAEKTALLKFPTKDSTNAEKAKFDELVRKYAVKSDLLVIGQNCEPSPFVISVDSGATFTIKNSDSIRRAIQFSKELSYELDPGKSAQAKADLGPGIHGLNCGGIDKPSGILLVN